MLGIGYYSIKYACIFGGRSNKKRITTGTRSWLDTYM
ncbi:unnamed protein product [Larinioides sclopetarius]|uniref:Uncharacterized protein n=1 Tax=Larinioides sclopetarius TaxID=280406 RepID=A0AAV2BMV7_9ARAC